MTLNLGINLVEVNGATPSIQGAPTSVAGFVIRSQRGVPGVVTQVSSFSQFTDSFGGYVAAGNNTPGTSSGTQVSFVGAYAIRGFFDNGGTLAYVTRIVATTAVPVPPGGSGTAVTPATAASLSMSLQFGTAAPIALTLTAAFRGQADPGAWGSTLAVSVVPNLNVAGGFDLTVVSQSKTPGVVAPTNMVLETWTKLVIGGAPGAQDPSVINDPNTGSKYVMVTTGAFTAWQTGHPYALGAYVINGTNVYLATTAGTSAATGAGPVGTGTSIADGTVVWTFVPPTIAPAWQTNHAYLAGTYATNGTTLYVVKTAGTSAPAGPAGTGTGIVDGSVRWASVAAWQASHAYAVGASATNGGNTYVVTTAGTSAATGGPTGTGTGILDGSVVWAFVPTPAAWRASNAYAVGAYVTNYGNVYQATTAGTSAAAPTGPTGTGTSISDGTVTWTAVVPSSPYTPLANGNDDNLSATTVQTLDTALTAPFTTPSIFDSLPVELFACPETSTVSVVQQALTYCFNRGDCMFVGHVPDYGAQPLAAAKAYGQQLQADKVYGALYLPYIQVVDPIGSFIWIPPTGHVLGVYARTDQTRGIWKAPAGNAALVNDALNVRATLNDTDHTDLVKNGCIDAIRPITGVGMVIDSSRTLSTNPLWLYVNVRLLFNYVKSSLRLGLRWVVQEPNDPTLWNKIVYSSVTPFLMTLWRRGAFGPGAPADVFTVEVDAVNNPPASIQQGILNIAVFFYPSRPAETIVITVGQQEGAATAGES